MARQSMQKCRDCGAHSLHTTCPKCGGNAFAAAPMKWSPEDTRAELRRKLENVEQKGWSDNLPDLSSEEEE